jgi:subtilase family serine protease
MTKTTSTSETIAANTLFLACKETICAELGGEISILNLKTGVYFTLSPVAATVWRQISTPTTLLQLQESVMSKYEVTTEQCHNDLIRLFERLLAEQLVEIVH